MASIYPYKTLSGKQFLSALLLLPPDSTPLGLRLTGLTCQSRFTPSRHEQQEGPTAFVSHEQS